MRTVARFRKSRAKQLASLVRVAAVCLAAAGLGALAGCGSSKPGYCSDRSNLENSIKGLTNLNLSSGISGLQAQLKTIQSNATKLVSSAKSHRGSGWLQQISHVCHAAAG